MSVAEYKQKFTELSQYALPIIAEERDICRKFEQGLRKEIRTPVTSTANWDLERGSRPKAIAVSRPEMPRAGESVASTDRKLMCPSYGKRHLGVCYSVRGVCFQCSQAKHLKRDCPQVNKEAPTTQVNQSKGTGNQGKGSSGAKQKGVVGRPQQKGRVQFAYVLFDPGATHSFISSMFASSIDRLSEPMSEELYISTPIGDDFYVDLLPLDLLEFDAILGMDFLSKYRALVDCYKKEVVFRRSNSQDVILVGSKRLTVGSMISAVKAKKLLSKGCKAYWAHVVIAHEKKLKPEDVLVVNEFLDVFLEELSRLPPDRELEFTIDLIPGTTLIS
ncbi:uncharacterized protein LOC120072053 [Benincasa hispida]|uniref:uncharacterized protein LOC120072053 n=1 Tax=Benincasa hispida TaxID=102211 RepID=UPI0019023149|nr:uncharacterized protein LOC120072053 [Benincasa hispida]